MRYKQWWWCWKSICIALTKYKGRQFSSLLLRKITFPKSTVPFSHLLLSLTRRGRLSQLASVCRLIQMDMASRPPVPHRPSGWTWLPGYRWEGGPLTFGEPWTPTPSPPLWQTAGWATYPALTIIPDWIQVAFPTAIITDSWSILGHYHRTLPQTQCQHASPGRGVCVWSLRWKGAVAWRLRRGASERRTLWAELEPWGAAGLTGCVAEHAGPQLKRRSEGCTSEQQSPLPSSSSFSLCLSLSLSTLSACAFSTYFYKPPYISTFHCDFWTAIIPFVRKIYKILFVQKGSADWKRYIMLVKCNVFPTKLKTFWFPIAFKWVSI